ncbi:MAG: 3'-5' exonuclease [Bacteroidota bacterium]
MKFLALDFETADYEPDSACAIGLIRVVDGMIVSRASYLIRPPRRDFVFTYIHGITWEDVEGQPTFRKLWSTIEPMFRDVDFLAAHNAGFDKNVLNACCAAAGIIPPDIPFKCSMVAARRVWGIYPTKLPNVCRHLGITLHHHDASSDAEACAHIMIKAIDAE